MRTFTLPLHTDLGIKPLQWMIAEGKCRNFGKPLLLVVSPEDYFAARELLASRPKDDDELLRDDHLQLSISPGSQPYAFELHFESGVVYNPGY